MCNDWCNIVLLTYFLFLTIHMMCRPVSSLSHMRFRTVRCCFTPVVEMFSQQDIKMLSSVWIDRTGTRTWCKNYTAEAVLFLHISEMTGKATKSLLHLLARFTHPAKRLAHQMWTFVFSHAAPQLQMMFRKYQGCSACVKMLVISTLKHPFKASHSLPVMP